MTTLWVRSDSTPIARIPRIGDAVWWAPKQVGLRITEANATCFVAVGGELVRRKRSGRLTPRWTVTTPHRGPVWDAHHEMWVVGRGKPPLVRGGLILKPDPVAVEADTFIRTWGG